jgi:hypothetical protein
MGVFLGDYSIHGKRPSVEEELAKHGSHNQKTHGGKGGSGGIGVGSGATPSDAKDDDTKRDDELVDNLATEVDELKSEIDEYYDDIEDGDDDDRVIERVSDSLDASTQNMDRAMDTKDYDTHTQLMDTAEGHLRDAATAASYGSEEFTSQFKRTMERLADKAESYVGNLEGVD